MEKKVFFRTKKLMEVWYLLITEKSFFWTFPRWEIRSFFEPKSWWKDYIYWLLKISCFWTFRRWEIRSFFEPESWWKDDIYWLLKSSCFELFGDGKYGLFLSQKGDGKMIFAWFFLAFHDISGLGKYGFSCCGVCEKEHVKVLRIVSTKVIFTRWKRSPFNRCFRS